MKCPEDGVLRGYLDRELEEAEHSRVREHLQSCHVCTMRMEAISSRAADVRHLLRTAEGGGTDTAAAYSRYYKQYGNFSEEQTGMAKRLFAFGSRPLWGAIAAALTMAVLLSFSPVQSWAQKVLLMLRAQKVAVVPVDFSAVATANDGDSRKLLAQLVSDEVTVTMDPGKPTSAATIDAASQAAGFQVKTLPNAGSPTKISVSNEGAFQMTLDRDRMQAVLDQAGRSDIQIPASVDGSLVAVHVPRIVHLQYGNCNATNGSAPQTNSTDTSCMHFVEAPSPTVSVPPGLDVSALAEAGLQVAGMSAADAHSFTQTIDWSSTLVVPIPQGRSSYQQASVDGVNGTVIEMPQRGSSPGRYLLLWVKNGIIYSLEGYGNSSTALAVAATLS